MTVTPREQAIIGGDATRDRHAAIIAKETAQDMKLPLDGVTILGGKVYINNKGLTIQLRRDERGPGSVAVEVVKDAWDDCDLDTVTRRMGSTSKDAVARWPFAGLMRAKCKATVSFPDGSRYEAFGEASIITIGMAGLHNPDYTNMMAECVPLRSEILTRRGFKHFDEVTVGEQVLAYDVATDGCAWTPLRAVTVRASLPMYRLSQRRGWSVDCTAGHSWAVERVVRTTPYTRKRVMRQVEDLNAADQLIIAAPAPGGEVPLTPIEAAILGWLATDGSLRRTAARRGTRTWTSWRGNIAQSKPEMVSVLRELLGAEVTVTTTPAGIRTFPSGRTYATQPAYRFHLPARIVTALFDKAGLSSLDDLPALVTHLSTEARAAMLEAMMQGDGSRRGTFGQKAKPGVSEAYQILATLQGRALGIPRMSSAGAVPLQHLRRRRFVSCNVMRREDIGRQAAWCPTTDFGTWIMRQDGNVMITGNTRAVNRAIRRATGQDTTAEELAEATPVRTLDDGRMVDADSGEIIGRATPAPRQPQRAPLDLGAIADDMAAETQDARAPSQTTVPRTVDEAARDLKEACLRVGLVPPATLGQVNTLAARYGVDIVGSSAGMTADWLERIRAALPAIPIGPLDQEHMTEAATALGALRATCRAQGRTPPQSLEALGALAAEAGLGAVASWDSVSVGWLQALQRHVAQSGGGAERPSPGGAAGAEAPATDRTERALAGWIAAAPDKGTLEQLATDVARAHEAGTLTERATEALLEAVDARGADLAARDLYPADRHRATEEGAARAEAQTQEVTAATPG